MGSMRRRSLRDDDVPTGSTFKPGRFGRMFDLDPLDAAPQALAELAQAMLDPDDDAGDNPSIPAGFTYLGQFVDHDITLDTTSLNEAAADPQSVHNFRTPVLELDSLYGLGPGQQPFLFERDGARFVVGATAPFRDQEDVLPSHPNDLPRGPQGFAVIGDARNDENLVVAQLHLAFLKFHNKVVDSLAGNEPQPFETARRLVTWHYQWIVWNEFVPKLVDPGVLADVRAHGRRYYRFDTEPFIPVEFSVAAYRLGHSMVRQVYSYNRKFVNNAKLPLLFTFTGLSGTIVPVPSNWIIDWRRFFDFATPPGGDFMLNPSRTLDPLLASSLHDLPGGGRNLAELNLLRGVKMRLPSGQDVAYRLGVPALTPAEIATGPDGAAAAAHGLHQRTPLWYYILKEAQVQAGGRHLGAVGSRIVAEVFLGLLEGDPHSYLRRSPTWTPVLPGRTPGDFTMVDLLEFVGDINPLG